MLTISYSMKSQTIDGEPRHFVETQSLYVDVQRVFSQCP